jgi:hypothetical protein
MTAQIHASATELTYEQIVEHILQSLRAGGALPPGPDAIPWDAFLRLSDLIHMTFDVPSTTFTPIMRRFLFGLGLAASPGNIVGVGTYVGYTFSWLLRDRSAFDTAPFFEKALGIDVDANANGVARRNCAVLNHGERLTYIDGDGANSLAGLELPIDLLYLDLDDPLTGKIAYRDTLESALPHLRSGALVLAHDACVTKFAGAFAVYHNFIRQCDLFLGPWVFPVDSCGLSLTVKK